MENREQMIIPQHEGIVVMDGSSAVTESENGLVGVLLQLDGINRATKKETTLYLIFPPEVMHAFIESSTKTLNKITNS